MSLSALVKKKQKELDNKKSKEISELQKKINRMRVKQLAIGNKKLSKQYR
jgi:hypothetical protein